MEGKKMSENDLREALAAYAHEAWSGWMKHMASKGSVVSRRREYWVQVSVPLSLVHRWERQMYTAYADLPESEKESDRAEADKMIAIVHELLNHSDQVLTSRISNEIKREASSLLDGVEDYDVPYRKMIEHNSIEDVKEIEDDEDE